ncbi:hypothetical protein BASA83_008656 [Batrachochytrium salamandrivorans]|nr:hypothetical protein BASA81_012767 [Batrachochytrium salamandrivorans]KAH9269294.1 hypothetical protein BASA83_008656 [Batrachochytrium salamandrivorans]
MRLISFVAISFLAITVSAQAPWDSPYQSLQQFDQAEVEQARLTAAYEKENAIFSSMNSRLKIDMQEIIDLKDKANLIAIRFRETDLDDNDKRKLRGEYYDVKAKLDVLVAEYNKQLLVFIKIRTACDSVWAALNLLMENQGLIVDYNGTHDVQTGPSPGTCYNLDFLKEQTDTIPKRIEDLHDKLKGIKANEASLNDDLKVRSDELEDRIRRLGVQREIAKDILRKHKQSRSVGARIRDFFNSYLPNARVE